MSFFEIITFTSIVVLGFRIDQYYVWENVQLCSLLQVTVNCLSILDFDNWMCKRS